MSGLLWYDASNRIWNASSDRSDREQARGQAQTARDALRFEAANVHGREIRA